MPLLPWAAESLSLGEYDLVVSSSYGWAHGVIPADEATHVCYMHSPPRYLWGEPPPGRARHLGLLLAPLLQRARIWDAHAAGRVDVFVANSQRTALRIRRRYRRDGSVVHPPVDVERFRDIRGHPGGHLLAIGELTAYKRFDLAIQAARLAGRPLVVIGDGPERRRLRAEAADGDVRFTGRIDDDEVLAWMDGAAALLHPGVEDFGIVMVEALAAGIPVIASAAGGSAEIVQDGVGRLVANPSPDALAGAVRDLTRAPVEVDRLRRYARRFDRRRFRRQLRLAVRTALREGRAANEPLQPASASSPGARGSLEPAPRNIRRLPDRA